MKTFLIVYFLILVLLILKKIYLYFKKEINFASVLLSYSMCAYYMFFQKLCTQKDENVLLLTNNKFKEIKKQLSLCEKYIKKFIQQNKITNFKRKIWSLYLKIKVILDVEYLVAYDIANKIVKNINNSYEINIFDDFFL